MTALSLMGLILARCKAADIIVGSKTATAASLIIVLGGDVLTYGDTLRAHVEMRDAALRVVQPGPVQWNTEDSSVAAVSLDGLVTGMGQGTTNIIAISGGRTARARVWVYNSASSTEQAPSAPDLPRDSVDISWRAPTGRSINVRRGDNLQRALESAQRGDEVVIEAGAEFFGNYTLPAKAGDASSGWITVRTSALGQLPASGTRVDPVNHAALMPKIVTPNLLPALATAAGTSGWRLVGLELTVAPAAGNMPQIQQGLVLLGDGSPLQRSLLQTPSDLILDRVYVHGQASTNLKRCVALNSARTAIVDSQLLECHGKGFDSQAIGGWNGPGPYTILNNRLEAAGEVVMFGGTRPPIPNLVPTDITIRHNHLYRPMSWQRVWTVKNLFELKNAQRVLVEGNVMENNWVDGQIGFAVLLGSADTDYPWCVVQDVTVRFNHIHNSAGGFNLFEHYGNAIAMRRVAIRHNLVTSIGNPRLGFNGRMFQALGKIDDLAIENNTGFAPQIYMTFGDEVRPKTRFSFRNNVGGDALFPVHGGRANGAGAVRLYTTPGSLFEGNVIVTQAPTALLPPNNTYPRTRLALALDEGGIGLTAWRLSRVSPYRTSGTGASIPGADIDEIVRRLGGMVLQDAPRRR